MKQIINLKQKDRLNISEVETKVKSARNSNDYILINFGGKNEFIKIAFCKDQTYCVGYNFINMEFTIKLNYMIKQYPKTVTGKLSAWLCDWVNRLNR